MFACVFCCPFKVIILSSLSALYTIYFFEQIQLVLFCLYICGGLKLKPFNLLPHTMKNTTEYTKQEQAERTTRLVKDFQSSFCPYGYLDIQMAVNTYDEVGLTPDDLVEEIENFSKDCDTPLDKIDPCYIAYDSIFQQVRNEIDEATGKDILNDTKEQIEVYGNFMCTSFDYTEGAKKEFLAIVKKIKKEDRSEKLNWVLSQID